MPLVRFASFVLVLSATAALAQTPPGIVVPDWALPDSPTHKQVAPPLDFHRDPVTYNKPIGVFENQTDVGAALVPGDASYDAPGNSYTITSAGYNIWYTRDEFRYLWKRMSGDVSLAATITFPDPNGFGDRKAALVIRQGLNDDSIGSAGGPAWRGHGASGAARGGQHPHQGHGISRGIARRVARRRHAG